MAPPKKAKAAARAQATPEDGEYSTEGFTYTCPDEVCGFVSRGWPTQAAADDRGKQHQDEHETGEPMPELAELEA